MNPFGRNIASDVKLLLVCCLNLVVVDNQTVFDDDETKLFERNILELISEYSRQRSPNTCNVIWVNDAEKYWKLRKRYCYDKEEQLSMRIILGNPGCYNYFSSLWFSHRWFCYKLNFLLNLRIALVSLNAYISTLGGGYFLCRHLLVSEFLAIRQLSVAKYLGDEILMSQCRIHLIYNKVVRGKLRTARRLIKAEEATAKALRSESLLKMLEAAESYVFKLKIFKKKLEKESKSVDLNPAKLTHGNYARQMFVK